MHMIRHNNRRKNFPSLMVPITDGIKNYPFGFFCQSSKIVCSEINEIGGTCSLNMRQIIFPIIDICCLKWSAGFKIKFFY